MTAVCSPSADVGRISDQAAFKALRHSPDRARRGPLTVAWVTGDGGTLPRVGYAIGRRFGGAVERNLARRRLRAIFREVGPRLGLGSYLVSVAPSAARSSFMDLRTYVCEALRTLNKLSPR
ncbi:MAG: ribonuclease P protein component [Acidimicrobiales bacterium]